MNTCILLLPSLFPLKPFAILDLSHYPFHFKTTLCEVHQIQKHLLEHEMRNLQSNHLFDFTWLSQFHNEFHFVESIIDEDWIIERSIQWSFHHHIWFHLIKWNTTKNLNCLIKSPPIIINDSLFITILPLHHMSCQIGICHLTLMILHALKDLRSGLRNLSDHSFKTRIIRTSGSIEWSELEDGNDESIVIIDEWSEICLSKRLIEIRLNWMDSLNCTRRNDICIHIEIIGSIDSFNSQIPQNVDRIDDRRHLNTLHFVSTGIKSIDTVVIGFESISIINNEENHFNSICFQLIEKSLSIWNLCP